MDRSVRHHLLLAGALALAVVTLQAAPKPAVNTSRGGLAIQGYDAVEYFRSNKAVAGRAQIEHIWNGARWRFASTENRDRFAAAPEMFAPQFGGYCAYAVSRGYTATIDPQAFTIVDGHLYLNCSKSVRTLWEQDIPGHIAKGRANWPGVLER
jgi:hypothetical protein